MSRQRLPLADLKQKLARQTAGAAPAPTPAAADDAQLLHEALRGVTAMRASRQAEIERPRPAPRPRPRAAAAEPGAVAPKRSEDDWIPPSWKSADPAPSAPASGFAALMSGVHRVESRRIEIEQPKPRPMPLQHERDEQAALQESIYAPTSLELHLEGGDELSYLCRGVPRTVLRDLRRGRWVVQEELDLHGCNRDEARDLLAACMGRWKKDGLRCVRVVHGKGRGSPGREPVLKKLVAGWLMNYADVMAYCQARLADGGAGALIVLLRSTRKTALL